MHRLSCPTCGTRLFFENSRCLGCSTQVGFCPDALAMHAIEQRRVCGHRTGPVACNWLLGQNDAGPLCLSCVLTRTAPDLSATGAAERWRLLEQDKRRLCYALLRADIRHHVREMVFDVLSDPQALAGGPPAVVMGHLRGVITLNLAEADPGYRERTRSAMEEDYRTVLGHIRHESGHFVFPRLVAADAEHLARFRALFGDERADYGEAMEAHHRGQTVRDPEHHVSYYAASHPHEDWAETWAHLLHVLDTLETARAMGLDTDPNLLADPYAEMDMGLLQRQFARVVRLLNELNRSLGLVDAYPFVLRAGVVTKLAFVSEMLRRAAQT